MYVTLILVLTLINKIESNCIQKTFENTQVRYCTDYSIEVCSFSEITDCATNDNLPSNVTYIQVLPKVNKLNRGAFQNLENLEYILVQSSGIQAISASCFINLPKAKVFYGSLNEIRKIPHGVFSNTTFRCLYFTTNKIEEIEEEAFSYMPRLEVIWMQFNRLKSIERNWFIGSPEILILDFKNNDITTVKSEVFNGLAHLSRLDLSFNNIHNIESNAFKGLNLNALNLFNNNVSIITAAHFGYKISVKVLLLGMNRLTSLPASFIELANDTEYLQLFPNPWTCACLKQIEDWGRKQRIGIYKPKNDELLAWKEDLPICIFPEEVPRNYCDNFYYTYKDDQRMINEYFKIVKYKSLVSQYGKTTILTSNLDSGMTKKEHCT